MAEYHIDDLAHASGTTVRSLRMLQDRGLLPPPELRGRTGWYLDHHLSRVRLVLRLQERGYTMAVIRELLAAWESGRDLGDVLGVERSLPGSWDDERPRPYPVRELVQRFGPQLTRSAVRRALASGILRREETRLRARNPRLLDVATDLVAHGLPLPVVLDLSEQLRRDMAGLAERLTKILADHLMAQLRADDLPDAERPGEVTRRVALLSSQLRRAADTWFTIALRDAVAEYAGPPGTAGDEGVTAGDPLAGLDLDGIPD